MEGGFVGRSQRYDRADYTDVVSDKQLCGGDKRARSAQVFLQESVNSQANPFNGPFFS